MSKGRFRLGHTVKVEGNRLVIEFTGLEQLAVLGRKLEVDPCDIDGVIDDVGGWEGLAGLLRLKVAGIGLPGHLVEGRYLLKEGGEAIVSVRDPSRAVRIKLRRGPYREVIMDFEDKQSAVGLIEEMAGSCAHGIEPDRER